MREAPSNAQLRYLKELGLDVVAGRLPPLPPVHPAPGVPLAPAAHAAVHSVAPVVPSVSRPGRKPWSWHWVVSALLLGAAVAAVVALCP